MWRRILAGALLLSCLSTLSSTAAQETTQSLGELARKERERKKAEGAKGKVFTEEDLAGGSKSDSAGAPLSPDSQPVVVEELGLKLAIPKGWKAEYIPLSEAVSINCEVEIRDVCRVYITSSKLPPGKDTITDADRESWKTRQRAFCPIPRDRTSSRDFEVAGYPAYEIIGDTKREGMRMRFVYVLARDAGRLYDFCFNATTDGPRTYDMFAPDFEKVLQSLSPPGRPGSAASSQATAPSEKSLRKLKPEEESANFVIFGLYTLEVLGCNEELQRACTLDEMVEGVQAKSGKKVGGKMERDVRKDPNYEFGIKAGNDFMEISAIPRKAGLGWFLLSGEKTYFNPNGPATTRDLVMGKDVSDPLQARELAK